MVELCVFFAVRTEFLNITRRASASEGCEMYPDGNNWSVLAVLLHPGMQFVNS
jgi:hypothetical protein